MFSFLIFRFPQSATKVFVYAEGNYFDPRLQGLHIDELGCLESTKEKLEELSKKLYPEKMLEENDEEILPTSPTSRLLLKRKKKPRSQVFTSPILDEFSRYEAMPGLNNKAQNQVNNHKNYYFITIFSSSVPSLLFIILLPFFSLSIASLLFVVVVAVYIKVLMINNCSYFY